MIRLLQFLIFGHFHKWETLEAVKLTDLTTESVGTRYIQRCERCGEVVKRDLI